MTHVPDHFFGLPLWVVVASVAHAAVATFTATKVEAHSATNTPIVVASPISPETEVELRPEMPPKLALGTRHDNLNDYLNDDLPPKPALAPPKIPLAIGVPAKASRVVTAEPKGKTDNPSEEPVSFVTDPDGGEYGSGVVAKGVRVPVLELENVRPPQSQQVPVVCP